MTEIHLTKDWCIRMAELEGNKEIGAGAIARPHLREDGIPTRCDTSLMSDAEVVITSAMRAVEMTGSSTALTDAVVLLGKARDRVADHVEELSEGMPQIADPASAQTMTQHEITKEIAALLRDIVHELRRSTKPQDWDDMPGLQRRIAALSVATAHITSTRRNP